MKKFKKMLLLNWHYISREIIEFETINFLTGKNASGKSTLIDAMQLLLLGEPNGSYFNKAANDKSRRTLLGYAKGELSDSDASFNYLRSGRFTTHLALEVYDEVKHQSFVMGFLMDVEGDNSYDYKYYWMEGVLPDHGFVRDQRAMSQEEIRSMWKREGKRHFFYSTNTDYRNDFKVKMGHLNDKYFDLFKKAVAFKPDVDLKRFITEFICETENQVDIIQMQDNIRHYERLKQEAEMVAAMIEQLEGISEIYREYQREKQGEALYGFLIRKGDLETVKEALEGCNSQLKALEVKGVRDADRLQQCEKALETGQLEVNQKNSQLAEFEPYRIEQDCKRKIDEIKRYNDELDRDVEKVRVRLSAWCRQWLTALEDLNARGAGMWTDAEIDEYSHATAELEHMLRNVLEAVTDQNFKNELKVLQSGIFEAKDRWSRSAQTLDTLLQRLEGDIREAEAKQRQLHLGIKSFEEPVVKLKALLEEKLSEEAGSKVAVDVFCELIDISDDTWKNAIEGYLHTQKFHLIVEPKVFDQAMRLYDRHKHDLCLYSVGLVDVGKLMEKAPKHKAGSLAEEILTENPYARAYADYLLGQVMKCDDVVTLRQHRVAITASGMLYKNFVAVQMNPVRYEFPYIGQRAVERQLELYETRLMDLSQKRDAIQRKLKPLEAFHKLTPLADDTIEDYIDAGRKQAVIHQNLKDLRRMQKTLEHLDMSAILSFREELERLEQAQEQRRLQRAELIAGIQNDLESFKMLLDKEIPSLALQYESKLEALLRDYADDYRIELGEPRYQQEYVRLKSHEKIRDNFDQSYKTARIRREESFNALLVARGRFETANRRDLGMNAAHNDKYDALLGALKETELPSFVAKIDDAIRKAQQEFKDDFISKLKSNIDTVNRQIDALNAALKSIRFGKDQYRFEVRPSDYHRKYYDMIMDEMLMNGYNLFSSDFQARHKVALDELFKKIVDVGESGISAAERAEMEKNIEKYTDYRTYLEFDLVVTDENGVKSHLSKMFNKKSGGETQTPFFISVLASFHRLYSLGDKRREDTMRLIIFDEAFSKMDHERIEESLKLLRDMQFQALISAPTEKIANIAPFADKTLCVLRTRQVTKIREWEKIKMEG